MTEILQDSVLQGGVDPPNQLVVACVQALERATPRLGRVFKSQMKEGPLTMQQVIMLQAIHDEARPSELAKSCNISSSATTAALDGLVRGGYCIRTHSEEDRREVLVHITPKGVEARATALAGADAAIREMLQGWDELQMQRLLATLQDLEQAADAYLSRHCSPR